jgi:hypothetical protein
MRRVLTWLLFCALAGVAHGAAVTGEWQIVRYNTGSGLILPAASTNWSEGYTPTGTFVTTSNEFRTNIEARASTTYVDSKDWTNQYASVMNQNVRTTDGVKFSFVTNTGRYVISGAVGFTNAFTINGTNVVLGYDGTVNGTGAILFASQDGTNYGLTKY